MADTGKPANKSGQEAQVRDSMVRDADKTTPKADPGPARNDSTTSSNHPVSREPIERVQHADREPPEETTTNARPGPLSAKDRERFDELRSKQANPNVLPPHVRTEDEEHEFRKLSKVVADYDRQMALEAGRPEARLNPKQRLDELKRTAQKGEGVEIETRRLEELIHDEKRIAELQEMDKRVVEEDEELNMLMQRVADARRNGGFDPNG